MRTYDLPAHGVVATYRLKTVRVFVLSLRGMYVSNEHVTEQGTQNWNREVCS